MEINFFGVRGSIATPGQETTYYGGNTPCLYVKTMDDHHIIFDCGTGIVALGDQLVKDDFPITILLSHNHWDHIQGFPFFQPAYQIQRQITIIPGLTNPTQSKAILQQMSGTRFPITDSALNANIVINEYQNIDDEIIIGECHIKRQRLNHPSSGSAYLVNNGQYKFAYVTDNELRPPNKTYTSIEQWQNFFADIDLLIHDSQYLPDDFPQKCGWGHSPFDQVVELAIAAKVKTLCLFSHDYRSNDDAVNSMLVKAQQQAQQKNASLDIFAARERTSYDLTTGSLIERK